MAASESSALVLAKSLALVEKTKRRVAQIDGAEFPTSSSEIARGVLGEALDTLAEKSSWSAMDPDVLYNCCLNIQSFVEQLEDSNSAHISWPLVSCCDDIWRRFFPNNDAHVFYSVTTDYNYSISRFSLRLERLFESVLTDAQIKKILGGKNLYCLQLASVEDDNLPLYANIGHEFGHAFLDMHEKPIRDLLNAEAKAVVAAVVAEFPQDDPDRLVELKNVTDWVIGKVATELFCDLVGYVISGPAFLLSLHEVTSWGLTEAMQGVWSGAYPSHRFRAYCLSELINGSEFKAEISKLFKGLGRENLRQMADYFSSIPTDHSGDRVSFSTFHAPAEDRLLVEAAIRKHLKLLKIVLGSFLKRCWGELAPLVAKVKEFPPVPGEAVFELLLRLEGDTLPNMVPDGTLLARTASFASILNASAIYRLCVLRDKKNAASTRDVYREVQKIERLTAKALEVSFVQRDFKAWETKMASSSKAASSGGNV